MYPASLPRAGDPNLNIADLTQIMRCRRSRRWRRAKAHMAIHDLAKHTSRFVTVVELADYWLVSPQQIRHHIDAGALEAVRLSLRLYRIPVEAALRFEQTITRLPSTEAAVQPLRPQPHKSKAPEPHRAAATARPGSRRLALARHD